MLSTLSEWIAAIIPPLFPIIMGDASATPAPPPVASADNFTFETGDNMTFETGDNATLES